ncbi:hypothetical protein sscle_05g041810 [Sclerotinia sclerotiorum 1980 UF-70]|uniref:tripeptidyl-peptidase II n=1 Tax=Sclerotinia sclerotiorum (strain ATCC 18683 / 1980 / Ss-1) TaxID=665079 RepID=A0A1D9Q385_SCLS1|nr:hypothetical protein sscle_05g041810 [Sclerotinia sclerotiorum 1980 UF-70]
MHFSLIVACSLLTGAIAAPASQKRHVVHERRDQEPRNWRRENPLHPDSHLPMRFAITQNNLHNAEAYLMDVSNPSSANYGKHWSAKKVAETFAPSAESVKAVFQWLEEYGIKSERVKQSQSLNWIHANVTVAEAESLLNTKYYAYTHAETGQSAAACDDYSVPENLRKHIDFITPTLHFDAKVAPRKMKRENTSQKDAFSKHRAGSPNDPSLPKQGKIISVTSHGGLQTSPLATCNTHVTPDCLRALYGLPAQGPSAKGNSYGIVEYTPQAYLPADLDLFFGNFSPALVGARPIFDSIDGGVLQTIVESFDYNGESDLDLEYGMALAYPQKVTLYQAGDIGEGASFNNFLDAIDGSYCKTGGGDDPDYDAIFPDTYGNSSDYYKGPPNCGGFAATKVISTSYGFDESDLTPAYERRQCNEYLKLGLQGVTILYSSGDYGVAGNGGECGAGNAFSPSFPGTCPYITSVGATQIKPNATVTQPEEAAESVIYSGGGFSNVFSMPKYQSQAVATYFAKYPPPYTAAQYNNSQTTRGYPDISANGVNYVVAVDGEFSLVYGTSASSPVIGAIFTLINAARINAGKAAIGFVNPVLYAHPSVLNDITSGGNQGCGTAGFTAVKGWDPVTGLGTPNYPNLLKLYLSLP